MILRDEPSLAVAAETAKHALDREDSQPAGAQDSDETSDEEQPDLDFFERRAEVRATAHVPDAFGFALRGGRWTAGERGVAFDSYRSFARQGIGKGFCEQAHMPSSATFSIALYGDEACMHLCTLWVATMNYLMELSGVGSRAGRVVLADADIDAFEPPQEAAAHIFSNIVPGAAARRARCILALRPGRRE